MQTLVQPKQTVTCPRCHGTGEITWTEWYVDEMDLARYFTNSNHCGLCKGKGRITKGGE